MEQTCKGQVPPSKIHELPLVNKSIFSVQHWHLKNITESWHIIDVFLVFLNIQFETSPRAVLSLSHCSGTAKFDSLTWLMGRNKAKRLIYKITPRKQLERNSKMSCFLDLFPNCHFWRHVPVLFRNSFLFVVLVYIKRSNSNHPTV